MTRTCHTGTPYRVYFPAIRHWMQLCTAPTVSCAACRQAKAAEHARLLGYDVSRALAKWTLLATDSSGRSDPEYLAARDIQRRVIAECFLHGPDWTAYRPGTTVDDLVLVDAVGPAREAVAA